ncbi:hypothetical protein [Streptacidiphilus sp. EB129]|uniref:hypothetical protein n=1 Tax=Streptacidiphilus sp. EB129 TaxID=3156262 RepID=UPI003512F41F
MSSSPDAVCANRKAPRPDTAPAASLAAFAHGSVHLWDEIADQAPQGSSRQRHMAASARAWADDRKDTDL